MSVISNKVLSLLNELFPKNTRDRIYAEQYINYKGQKLFFDFYIKELSCYVECQGAQHTKFIKHFHGNMDGFYAQKYRDNLKIEYVQSKNMYLIRIYDGEYIDKDVIMDRINKAFDSEYNFSD